jgi:hypothetical protein
VKFLRVFANFWYDLVIGDDWKIAAYTTTALGVVIVLVMTDTFTDGVTACIGTGLLFVCFVLGLRYDAHA